MNKIITIAIDAMGGDNSPDKTIQGIRFFLEKNKNNNDFFLNIFGDKDLIEKKLKKYNISSNSINTPQPPTPGLPLQAPSVYIFTVFIRLN